MALRGWFEDNELTPNEWLELLFEYLRGQDTDDIDRIYRRDEAQELKELFTRYADGQASADELIAFELDFLKDIEGVADWWDQTVSIVEADRIIETMEDNPNGLQYLPSPKGTKTTEYLETAAMSFAGATPTTPITTVGNKQVVLRGGAGVTIDIGNIIGGGAGYDGILDNIVPYIPGISLPNWMPTAGVIFLPSVGNVINRVNDVAGQIGDAIESGESLEDILGQVGAIVVQEAEEITDELRGQWEGLRDTITEVFTRPKTDEDGNIIYTTDEEGNRVPEREVDPTGVSGVLAGVITGSYPDLLPSWMPDLLGGLLIENLPNVYSAVRNTLIQSGATTEELFPPLEEEIVTEEQDPTLMFTNRGDNYFVSSEGDEYFQLAESEDIDFELNGQYTREQLENTGLETINSGTYQSLIDDLSFHALEEDIYEYSMEELIERYETEGGILPGDWKLMDEESQYNFFLDDYFDIPRLIEDPDKDDLRENDDVTDDVTDNVTDDVTDDVTDNVTDDVTDDVTDNVTDDVTDDDTDDDSVVADLFEDVIGESEQRILDEIANANYATPQDIADALEEANLLTEDNLRTTLENAGFATPQDIADAFDAAGLATPQDVTDAIAAAGLATPQDIIDALDAFGFTDAQLEQIVGALPENLSLTDLNDALNTALEGLALGTDLDTATDTIIDAVSGLDFATSQDVRDALEAFGFTDEQLEQIAGVIPEGLTLAELNNALTDSLSGIALGTDLDEATTTITDAIGGLAFATTEDIENALLGFNFTQDQLDQISELIPDTLRAGEVEDLLETALTGVSTQEDVDTAFTNLTTNLAEGVSGLEAGQEDILTGQTRIGEEVQSVEDLIMSSTGLLTALGAAGLVGGGASRPAAKPFKQFKETFDYAPQEVKPVETKSMDYNKEVDRLLTMGMGGKKPGMLV